MLNFLKLLQISAVENPADGHGEPEGEGAQENGGGEGDGFVDAEGDQDQGHGAFEDAWRAGDDGDHREEFGEREGYEAGGKRDRMSQGERNKIERQCVRK